MTSDAGLRIRLGILIITTSLKEAMLTLSSISLNITAFYFTRKKEWVPERERQALPLPSGMSLARSALPASTTSKRLLRKLRAYG